MIEPTAEDLVLTSEVIELAATLRSRPFTDIEHARVAEIERGIDAEWTFSSCIVCGTEAVTRRALWVSPKLKVVGRGAWCDTPRCVADWRTTPRIPLRPEGGSYVVDDEAYRR